VGIRGMILEVILLAFFWHFFKWLFRLLLGGLVAVNVKRQKESLLEKVKTKTEDVKGAMKDHERATDNTDW
jgi:hypothetical protein